MPQLILLPTIAIEVIASLALEASDGFVRLEYLAGALLGFGLSLWLLARASAILPISITYPFGLRSGSQVRLSAVPSSSPNASPGSI